MKLMFLGLLLIVTIASDALAGGDLCQSLRANVAHTGDHEVPADLNAVEVPLAPVRIPVTVDLADRYSLDLPDGVELKPEVAAIEIHMDGRILYNGQDITPSIEDICTKGDAEHRQVDADVLKSQPETEVQSQQ